MSGSPLAFDLGLVVSSLVRSVSQSTWRGYVSAWAKWCSFCSDFQGNRFSDDSAQAIAFVCRLVEEGLSVASIRRVLAGVSFFFRIGGLSPLGSQPLLRQMLQGLQRSAPVVSGRRPISLSLLARLVQVLPSVCFSSFECLLFRSAFLLAFFGAFRLMELVAVNRTSPTGLLFSEACFCEEYLLLWLRRSKTDQRGRGRWIRLNRFLGSPLCPVEALRLFLDVRPSCGVALLCHEDGSPLTKFQFNSVLRRSLVGLGCGNFKVSAHSFRIGAATEAARLGLDESVIKRLGRWESSRYNLYVRPELVFA